MRAGEVDEVRAEGRDGGEEVVGEGCVRGEPEEE